MITILDEFLNCETVIYQQLFKCSKAYQVFWAFVCVFISVKPCLATLCSGRQVKINS